LKIFSNS